MKIIFTIYDNYKDNIAATLQTIRDYKIHNNPALLKMALLHGGIAAEQGIMIIAQDLFDINIH